MKALTERTKIALISLGVVVAVASPVIIIGSIYVFDNLKKSPEQESINNFYDQNEELFSQEAFSIYLPLPNDTTFYSVKNVVKENIIYNNRINLNNYSYDLEITKINPNITNGTINFNYKLISLLNPSVYLEKTSPTYSQFINSNYVNQNFDK